MFTFLDMGKSRGVIIFITLGPWGIIILGPWGIIISGPRGIIILGPRGIIILGPGRIIILGLGEIIGFGGARGRCRMRLVSHATGVARDWCHPPVEETYVRTDERIKAVRDQLP